MFFKVKLDISKKIISILIVIVMLLIPFSGFIKKVQANNSNKIIPRELAMFASLAYADLENIEDYDVIMDNNNDKKAFKNIIPEIKKSDLTFKETTIVSDAQLESITTKTSILGLEKETDENTYQYLFSGLASTTELGDWKLVNYAKFNTTAIKGMAEFTAMTFKRGNDIVIAYRGTDFDDAGDWIQDILYGAVNYAGQEGVTQDYARLVAEHYARNNNNINIYVTGHSLGGYLAQIGGAELAGNPEFKDNLKEVIYFNGMGLKFWSNIKSNLTPSLIAKLKLSKANVNEIKNDKSLLNRVQDNAKIALKNWKNNGGKLICYSINGDLISSLGTHVGEQIGLNAHNVCINHHNGNQTSTDVLSTLAFKLIRVILNKDISIYVDKYKPKDIIGFVWMTHETDSFLGMLPYADGTLPANINVKFDTPSVVKYNKTSTATLTITTIGGKLQNKILNKNNISVANSNRISITAISKPTEVKVNGGYKYTYKITLKGKILIGNSNISLKPNTLKISENNKKLNKNIFSLLSGKSYISATIRTNLR